MKVVVALFCTVFQEVVKVFFSLPPESEFYSTVVVSASVEVVSAFSVSNIIPPVLAIFYLISLNCHHYKRGGSFCVELLIDY